MKLESEDDELQSVEFFAFDTVIIIKAATTMEVMSKLQDRCTFFENTLSRTIEGSDVGRINAAGGEPVTVEPTTADLISKALVYCDESEGRFDITIGAATSLWDFKEGIVPDPDELAEAVTHIDYTQVMVDGTTVTLADPKGKIDLGGIAKGYIADDLVNLLLDEGCESAFVNLGGNVKTLGCKPDGSPWNVGIQDPADSSNVLAKIASENTSVVTSGLYERVFEKDGRRYWHILDPKTGYPVETDVMGATIVSEASIDGDGFTKPLFMMNHEDALAFIEERQPLQGLLVLDDGTILQTENSQMELL
ncbi:FAD:protein FMN transferase [Slackia heliotrinireducens]|uniref:FAD:protein FMN transferase n=1 Tax=Slackia heliotrinireducens TaxID=84110 RepID=UPI003315216B